jgi:light-regulated signal transduction histidine kinase (bacteriophytochrome)
MEKTIIDILNAGIGLMHAGKEGLDKARVELEKAYSDTSSKGAQDNTEASVKLRESVDKIIADIKEFSSVAGKNYDETRTKIIENYNKIVEQINNTMPEGKVEEIKAKIDEIVASIQKTTQGGGQA